MKAVHQKIYELLKSERGCYLLDAACGKGGLGAALEESGITVFSMDRYDYPLRRSRFIRADLNSSLPYREKSFDFVICSESLQYMENHENLFREFGRVLKNGGSLVVSLPNILTVSSRLYFLRRGYFSCFKPLRTKEKHKEWDHVVYNLISFVEVFQLMKKIGFDIKRVIAADITFKGWWLYPPIKALYLAGLIFDRDKEKAELITWMASRELLMGDHIVICGMKAV